MGTSVEEVPLAAGCEGLEWLAPGSRDGSYVLAGDQGVVASVVGQQSLVAIGLPVIFVRGEQGLGPPC